MYNLFTIFLAAILTHNFALSYLLGMCPLLAMSKNIHTATCMGIAVTIVMVSTSLLNWFLFYKILIPTNSEVMSYLIFIIIIASFVQVLEMLIEKFLPKFKNSFGIFLPLITVNCIILAVSLFIPIKNLSFFQTLFFAFGAGVGWSISIICIAAIREKIELICDIPNGLKGAGITMIVAGILALAFIGFGGIVNI